MLGAIIGDVGGSAYEFNNIKTKQIQLFTKSNTFTDDTICTVSVMDWILHESKRVSQTFQKYILKWTKKYQNVSYGSRFRRWMMSDNPQPYYSYGNGAAMRISPIAWVANDLNDLELLSNIVTSVTHDHPEGLKSALVVSTCIFMAIHGSSKEDIFKYAITQYPEIKDFIYEELKRTYTFDETCQGSVPQAIYHLLIFHES